MTTELITPAESFAERTDVLIIGSGAAGLTAALTIVEATQHARLPLSPAVSRRTAPDMGQGGLAASSPGRLF